MARTAKPSDSTRAAWGALSRGRIAPVITLIALMGLTVLLTRRAVDMPRYRVPAATITVASVPSWLSGGAAETGLDRALLSGECSVFDANLPRLAAEAASKKPWVREVRTVQRVFPNAVELEVELRTPVALLTSGNERIMVDAEGFVIERHAKVQAGVLPLVTATAGAAPIAGGRLTLPQHAAWLEAIALLNALRSNGDHPALESLQVKEVRVGVAGTPRKAGDCDLVLITDKPARIVWGIAPGSDPTAGRADTRAKLDALRLALVRFEGLVGVAEVNLSYPGGCDIREVKAH